MVPELIWEHTVKKFLKNVVWAALSSFQFLQVRLMLCHFYRLFHTRYISHVFTGFYSKSLTSLSWSCFQRITFFQQYNFFYAPRSPIGLVPCMPSNTLSSSAFKRVTRGMSFKHTSPPPFTSGTCRCGNLSWGKFSYFPIKKLFDILRK